MKYKFNFNSDMNDCVNMGTTSYGTPVDIFKPVGTGERTFNEATIRFDEE